MILIVENFLHGAAAPLRQRVNGRAVDEVRPRISARDHGFADGR